jgi:multisubunit Na+/H+ antiporter MnhE subunit
VHSRVRFVLWWAVSAALWLVLAATLARPDVIAAVFAGFIVAWVAALRERLGLVTYRFRFRWLTNLPRLAVQVMRDLVILGRALLHPRRVTGAFRALPITIGDGPHEIGRQALLGLSASLGPNTFVVDFDRERQLVLVHQLVVNESVLPTADGKYPPT